MDYTTLPQVKLALGATETGDDTLLQSAITAVSRSIDRTAAKFLQSDDYFKREVISNEIAPAILENNGTLHYFAKKPCVHSISALAWRINPTQTWQTLDPASALIDQYHIIIYSVARAKFAQVQISYDGGFATTTSALPADIIECATLLTVRFYKEIKSGLGDVIGVAELGTLQYTKAFPARFIEMLNPYIRKV